MIPDLLPKGVRKGGRRCTSTLLIGPCQENKLLRFFDRQHPQHDRVDKTEDRGVGADSQGERKNRDGRYDRSAAQNAEAVADVLEQRFDEAYPTGIAVFFLDLIHSAEFQPRAALCFCRPEPRPDERLDLLFKVKAQLLVHFRFDRLTAKEGA